MARVTKEFIFKNGGELPAYADGGYPLYYIQREDEATLCPKCANAEEACGMSRTTLEYDINYEDQHLFCEGCNGWIEPAYELD